MVSETELRETAVSLLSSLVDGIDFGPLAEALSAQEQSRNLELSPYGHVLWCLDHYGVKSAWRNVLCSDAAVKGYVEDAAKFRDDMPAMLVNAHAYVTSILANVADLDTAMRQLEGMSFPYVLYVLFAGSGQEEVVERYRPEAEEQLRRYPSTLDLLPESYRSLKETLLCRR